jgi:glutathione S-transferase
VETSKGSDGRFPDWYLRINPRSETPSLHLPDGSIMTESAAMMIHLADAHPEAGLAPAPGTAERARYLRWMIYLAANAYASDLRLYYPERYSIDVTHAPAIKAKAIKDMARDFELIAEQMGDGPFLIGTSMTAADIYAGMILSWSNDVQGLFSSQPKLKRLFGAVAAVPQVKAVWERNGVL